MEGPPGTARIKEYNHIIPEDFDSMLESDGYEDMPALIPITEESDLDTDDSITDDSIFGDSDDVFLYPEDPMEDTLEGQEESQDGNSWIDHIERNPHEELPVSHVESQNDPEQFNLIQKQGLDLSKGDISEQDASSLSQEDTTIEFDVYNEAALSGQIRIVQFHIICAKGEPELHPQGSSLGMEAFVQLPVPPNRPILPPAIQGSQYPTPPLDFAQIETVASIQS
jgi:hypothetical protein